MEESLAPEVALTTEEGDGRGKGMEMEARVVAPKWIVTTEEGDGSRNGKGMMMEESLEAQEGALTIPSGTAWCVLAPMRSRSERVVVTKKMKKKLKKKLKVTHWRKAT